MLASEKGLVMTFPEQMLDLWQRIFDGDQKFMFFVGLCIVTFSVPFLLIWVSSVFMEVYFGFILRKKYPDEWDKISSSMALNHYYKLWLKNEIDFGGQFFKIKHVHELFGKGCLAVWFFVMLCVGVIAIVSLFL